MIFNQNNRWTFCMKINDSTICDFYHHLINMMDYTDSFLDIDPPGHGV